MTCCKQGSMEDVKPKQCKKWFTNCQLDDPMTTKEMLLGGIDLWARSTSPSVPDLLQNCDLPPPLRLFSPLTPEEDAKKNKINPIPAMQYVLPLPVPSAEANQGEDTPGADHGGEESTSLLRALRLSQTRAREAEKKASLERTGNQAMARAFMEDSLRLSAYRQWVKLLEIEIWMLQSKGSPVQQQGPGDESGQSPSASTWCLTVAFCFGIATVGFVLGRYVF